MNFKELEYVGVMIAICAYICIVTGDVIIGFKLGALASVTLGIYFATIKSWPSVGLQTFFVCANIYGLMNLGII